MSARTCNQGPSDRFCPSCCPISTNTYTGYRQALPQSRRASFGSRTAVVTAGSSTDNTWHGSTLARATLRGADCGWSTTGHQVVCVSQPDAVLSRAGVGDSACKTARSLDDGLRANSAGVPNLLYIITICIHGLPLPRQTKSASKPVEGSNGGLRGLLTSIPARMIEGRQPTTDDEGATASHRRQSPLIQTKPGTRRTFRQWQQGQEMNRQHHSLAATETPRSPPEDASTRLRVRRGRHGLAAASRRAMRELSILRKFGATVMARNDVFMASPHRSWGKYVKPLGGSRGCTCCLPTKFVRGVCCQRRCGYCCVLDQRTTSGKSQCQQGFCAVSGVLTVASTPTWSKLLPSAPLQGTGAQRLWKRFWNDVWSGS